MRLLVLSLLCMPLLLCSAERTKKITYGIEEVHGALFDTFQAYGKITLEEVKVLGKMEVAGHMEALSSTMGELHIKGEARLHHCQVKKKTEVYGLLEAVSSKFDRLSVASEELLLDSCHVATLQLLEGSKPQVVKILGKSKVGSIKFSSGQGEVLLGPEAAITGKVFGGIIKKM